MSENEQLVKALEKQNELFARALDLKEDKAADGAQTANQLHGFDGLFSNTSEQVVVTAHIRPMGVSSVLPMFGTVDEGPIFSTITGFTDTDGGDQTTITGACQDASSAFMKACDLTARFGLMRVDTNEVEFDKTMLRINRGDFLDLRLAGQVLGLTNLQPRGVENLTPQILNVITAAEMVTAGIASERQLNNQIWQGTYGTQDKYGTQFAGLDSQIATGHVDQSTNTTCPAIDSDVKDFSYDDVTGTGRSIVEYMSMLEWYLYFNARRSGLLPLTWAWVMRPELWQVLTEIWPCQYNTNKCSSSVIGDDSRVVIDGRENIAQRDSMRSGMTIEVNGRRYSVVEDDGIYESNNINNANLAAGEYASSIYFVPLTVLGNMRATYREYLDYNSGIANANVQLLRGMQDFWTDDGIYSWAIEQMKWCYKLALKTEQRIILRTPQLAGKIQNVKYIPLQHLRSSDPTSPYFADGGVSLRNTDETFYAVWN